MVMPRVVATFSPLAPPAPSFGPFRGKGSPSSSSAATLPSGPARPPVLAGVAALHQSCPAMPGGGSGWWVAGTKPVRPCQPQQQQDPGQAHRHADHWTMGPDRAMREQASVGPPDPAQQAPALQGSGLNVKIRRQPEAAHRRRRGDAPGAPAQPPAGDHPDGNAECRSGAVMVSAAGHGRSDQQQIQAAAIRQN